MPQPLFTNPIGSPFIELQSVDSTNNYARQQLSAPGLSERQGTALHGTAYFAHEQVAGKGQRGKSWASQKGSNMALSIVIDPESLLLTQQFWLSACVAISVQEVFFKYAGDDTKVKWPNDLYWQDRKAGGILIESGIESQEAGVWKWDWAIAGIGININQTSFPGHLPNPVSLKQITGKDLDPVIIAKEVCMALEKNYRHLITKGFDDIYEQYNAILYKRNEKVKLKKENRVFEATIKKVSPSGQLITEHAIEETFDFGEVEWVI